MQLSEFFTLLPFEKWLSIAHYHKGELPQLPLDVIIHIMSFASPQSTFMVIDSLHLHDSFKGSNVLRNHTLRKLICRLNHLPHHDGTYAIDRETVTFGWKQVWGDEAFMSCHYYKRHDYRNIVIHMPYKRANRVKLKGLFSTNLDYVYIIFRMSKRELCFTYDEHGCESLYIQEPRKVWPKKLSVRKSTRRSIREDDKVDIPPEQLKQVRTLGQLMLQIRDFYQQSRNYKSDMFSRYFLYEHVEKLLHNDVDLAAFVDYPCFIRRLEYSS